MNTLQYKCEIATLMKTIRKGDKGADVKVLQQLLSHRGFSIGVDGDFGPNTEKAVIQFQKDNFDVHGHSLTPDGIVGRMTWQALLDSDKTDTPLKEVDPDPVTLDRIKHIHPKLREELGAIYQEIRERGINVRFAQVFRSFAQQDALYAKGRTAPGGRVTNAKAGQSYHNYGLAVDIVLMLPNKGVSWDMNLDLNQDGESDWAEIVQVFKHHGWTWGGDWRSFKDYPHFEKNFGLSTSTLKKRYETEDFEEKPYVRLN
jgi:peptidoglycan L-alanyl-D-glutamate endopeptidase CwlK